MFQVSYVFPPPELVPLVLSTFWWNMSIQVVDSGGTMLDGGSLAPHSAQHVGRQSLAMFHHKRSWHGCVGRPGAQGSAIYAFNPLAAQ